MSYIVLIKYKAQFLAAPFRAQLGNKVIMFFNMFVVCTHFISQSCLQEWMIVMLWKMQAFNSYIDLHLVFYQILSFCMWYAYMMWAVTPEITGD